MHKLRLKPTYKVVKNYYTELATLMQLSLFVEGAVSPTFAVLLRYCGKQFNWTLAGIPPRAFDYRLGNRSALEWVVDRYRMRTDKRSGIVNDPNRLDDPQYIVRLVGQVITVSLETVEIVEGLPALS